MYFLRIFPTPRKGNALAQTGVLRKYLPMGECSQMETLIKLGAETALIPPQIRKIVLFLQEGFWKQRTLLHGFCKDVALEKSCTDVVSVLGQDTCGGEILFDLLP